MKLCDLTADKTKPDAFRNYVRPLLPDDETTEKCLHLAVDALMRYAQNRTGVGRELSRTRRKAERIAAKVQKLLDELSHDSDLVAYIWPSMAASRKAPTDEQVPGKFYLDQLEHIRLWNRQIGGLEPFRYRLELLVESATRLAAESSIAHRPKDNNKWALGIELGMLWTMMTGDEPTIAKEADFDDPISKFGGFAKLAIEMLNEHAEFKVGFAGFIENAKRDVASCLPAGT